MDNRNRPDYYFADDIESGESVDRELLLKHYAKTMTLVHPSWLRRYRWALLCLFVATCLALTYSICR